ncbi:MAG: methyltransferase domain-containing protein [Candidatus Parcubacteria bacterium]|nr:methyltransferase domain-containing protein [Burkholderiales bacterium]
MTRSLSGETLSLMLDYLRQANMGKIDGPECGRLITAALSARDAFVTPQGNPNHVAPFGDSSRDKSIDGESLARLNVMLPWSSYNILDGEERILGSPWSGRKRMEPQMLPDVAIERLNRILPLKGLEILEVGCFEGHHTASLARYASELWAFDGRIENVIKTLVRLWVLGLEHAAKVEQIDIEAGSVAEQLARRGRSAKFDLVHHRGVLYHLSNPVEHLADVSALCARHIYLHSQIATKEQANGTCRSALGEFDAFFYKEPRRSYSPFAGMTEKATWLTRESLVKVLSDLGFADIRILKEVRERNGDRIELIASRSKA